MRKVIPEDEGGDRQTHTLEVRENRDQAVTGDADREFIVRFHFSDAFLESIFKSLK